MDKPCQMYLRDGYCADPDTRQYINGAYCRIHTPGVISGLPPQTPEAWAADKAVWQAFLNRRAAHRATRRTPTPRARLSDPQTSHSAARTVRGVTATHARIKALLRDEGPMTDEQIAEAWKRMVTIAAWPKGSPSGLRTRRAELVDRGEVVDTGRTALTRAGRRTTVWALPNRY